MGNRPISSCSEPRCESKAKCKACHMKISLFAHDFHSHANKTSFHLKSFALNLAFVMKLKATRKWPTRSFRFSSFNLSMSRALEELLQCENCNLDTNLHGS